MANEVEVNEISETELMELGLETAAKELSAKKLLKKKLTVAYENYRFVTPDVVSRFNSEVGKRTRKEFKDRYTYDHLVFIPLRSYRQVPPKDVLEAIRTAKERGCFDYFEVAKIESVEVRKDPIVFGCIEGCSDRFAVAQWDNDVRIEDMLKENEG